MTRTLLDNAQWDFGTNCFVCEPRNERGLGVPFYLDDEANRVVAEFTPQPHHSGAPMFAHGGVSMALLDEGMAWAVIAIARRMGVTRHCETTFLRPLRVGKPYLVSCWVEPSEGTACAAGGEVTDAGGNTCVGVRAEFTLLTEEQVVAAIGGASRLASSYATDG